MGGRNKRRGEKTILSIVRKLAIEKKWATSSDPEKIRVRLNKLTHLDFCTRSSIRLVCIDVHSE